MAGVAFVQMAIYISASRIRLTNLRQEARAAGRLNGFFVLTIFVAIFRL
jgi:hypothetical protein